LKKFITHFIADYIEQKRYQDFPIEVIRKAKECILDSIGCMLAGSKTREGRILQKSLLFHEKGISSILGFSRKTAFFNAIFINSTLVNILDFDDCYIGHPGATIIPPAINFAELMELTGKELITTIIIAYEVSIRLGLGLRPIGERKYILGHGTWQVFGSASIAAKLLKLNCSKITNAFGIAGANAPLPSVMKTTDGLEGPTMAKNNFGIAALVGAQSGFLAKNRFTGPKDIFDDENDFWRMIGCKKNNLDSTLMQNSEKEFKILDVNFKMYPCCRLTHSAIDTVKEYFLKNNIELKNVEKILVKSLSPLSKPPFTNMKPRDANEGRFSLPYALACVLYKINPLEWYSKKNINDSQLLDFSEKVMIEKNERADKIFKKDPKEILSTVIVIQKNKKEDKTQKIIKNEKTEQTMQEGVLLEKFLQLSGKCFKDERKAKMLAESIMELDKVKNTKEWLSNFQFFK
jgi:2-methylcitrate dehydratase PrpD